MNLGDSKKIKLLRIDKIVQSFYNLIVKSQLNCPKDSYILTIVCFWVGFFQISSMMDSFEDNGNSISSQSITWDEGWKVLIYFTRPIQFIYQEYSYSNQEINVVIIVLLFLYLAIHMLIAIVCSYLIESTNKNKVKIGFQILTIFVNCSIYFNSLFCIIVTETSLLLAFQGSLIDPENVRAQSQADVEKSSSSSQQSGSVSYQTINSTQKSINKICGYTLFFLYQMYSFMNTKFYEISYNLEEKGLQRYSSDNLSLLLNHIRIGAVIGYTYDPKGENSGQVITACFSSIYFVLLFYEYFFKKPYSSISKSDNYLTALVTNFIFLILIILNKVADVISSSISVTMILLVIPIIVKFLINAVHKMNDTYLYSNLLDENEITSQKDEQLSRKISMLYNNRELILQQDQLKLFGIYESHKLTCRRQMCFCQHNIIKCYEGTQFLLNSDILNRYIRYLIRTELFHSNLNEKIDRLVHFIRQNKDSVFWIFFIFLNWLFDLVGITFFG